MAFTISNKDKVKYTSENRYISDREELKQLDEKESPSLYLCVDLGTYLIKYSLFAVYDSSRIFLLNMELKDSKDIVLEGSVNSNLLNRDIKRKIDKLSKYGEKFKVLIITPKPFVEVSTLPNLEYKEEFKKTVVTIRESVKNTLSGELLTDWAIQANYPEKDRVSAYSEGVDYEFVIPAVESVIKLDLLDYKILSPVQPLIMIGSENELDFENQIKVVIDIGHSATTIIISKGRDMLASKIIQLGSKLLNEKINLPLAETIRMKHNSSINELPGDSFKIMENIKKECKEFVDSFEKTSIEKVDRVYVLGGVANSDIENLFNLEGFGYALTPITVDLENAHLLPREPLNYLALSYSAVLSELYSTDYEAFQLIDYTSPKDSNLMKLKKIIKWFSNNKKYAYSATGLVLLSVAIGAFGANKSLEEHKAYTSVLEDYTVQLSNAQGQLMSLESEYQNALNSVGDNDIERFNTGELLNKMVAITPPNLNVKVMKLTSTSETGILIVKSDDERLISAFITLLQDREKGVFNKVNIGKLDLKEVKGVKYYENQLFVEGFNF